MPPALPGRYRFDVSDVDAAITRERDLERRVVNVQALRARAFAQGFVEALDQGASAAEYRELYVEKAG